MSCPPGLPPERAIGAALPPTVVFEALGAPVDAAACHSLIRRIDATHRRPPRTAPGEGSRDGLTVREREVLGLVRAGLTNAQIAARMHVSTGTVKRHVAGLLRHFGAVNRRELIHRRAQGAADDA